MDFAACWTAIRSHEWTPRRMLIVTQLIRYAREIDGMEYGRVTFNLGPTTSTPEINAVKPKERVE